MTGSMMVANMWMRDQKRNGDGLNFMRWLYKPGLIRRALWPMVKIGMLRRKVLPDGRIVHRMPFRKSLNRDIWEPSERARKIREEWKGVRKSGGTLSFQESES